VLLLVLLLVLVLAGCGAAQSPDALSFVDRARLAATESTDSEVVGRWLAAELLAPGGDPKRARLAALRLSELGGKGRHASLARAIHADGHGLFAEAADGYLAALRALRDSDEPDAPLAAWFVAYRLASLQSTAPGLWSKTRSFVEQSLASPGSLGWRARGELVQWWSRERLRGGERAVDERAFDEIAERHGCLREAAVAGPFGHALRSDHRVHFEAEAPGPWPAQFRPNRRRLERPHTNPMVSHGCLLRPEQRLPVGVYYVQSFIELDLPQEVIIAAQGAFALFVDDVEVLSRDPAAWGSWPRVGVQLRLVAGRHRLLARLATPETTIRVLTPSGRPLGLKGSADQRLTYSLLPPTVLPDPNVLGPFLHELGVPATAGAGSPLRRLDTDDPVVRYLASAVAQIEGQPDVASVILEPLVQSVDEATPVALAHQAVLADSDPIFSKTDARDLAKDLRQRAAEADAELWGPRLWLALEQADRASPTELVTRLSDLAKSFPQVPLAVKRLAAAYAQLGWTVEHAATIDEAVQRFPDDAELLKASLQIRDRRGQHAEADDLVRRVRALDPTDEVEFRRALERGDYPAAIAELRRIGAVRQDRRDIALRIADLLVRAGKSSESIGKLELALAKDQTDGKARLALADARFATGDRNALTEALVEAIRTGAETQQLRQAIELTEGMTDLAPYRRDGLAIIAEAEASGLEMPGTAARILDYVTLWVEPDGSARMLEHEIIRVQAREGIEQHLEQQIPRGVLLRMRTIKQDGTVLEPELVTGKRTVTMPHLEVGDYIETESIWLLPGDGQGGRAFLSPRWWFRERNVSYHLSEFVVVSPADRPLDIETTGQVPEPEVKRTGALVVRRWRVDQSPALPEERFGAPFQEFMPSVRVGWGIDLEERLRRLIDAHRDETPQDPRLRRIAKSIVAGKLVEGSAGRGRSGGAERSVDDRAKRIYRWVLDNVQPGRERFAPRIITGKAGDRTRAFLHLCQLAGIDARVGMVQNRMSPPPLGPFSRALKFTEPAVRLATERGPRWLTVGERFAPYGYLPSYLRGQPAVLLDLPEPWTKDEPLPIVTERTEAAGAADRIATTGLAKLRSDGSAELRLEQRYHGKYAVVLRSRLNGVPEPRLRDVLEAEVLGLALPGARLAELEIVDLDDLDAPVGLTMTVEAPSFAKPAEDGLAVTVPFVPRLGLLAELPSRETPLYIAEKVATDLSVRLTVELPVGSEVVTELEPISLKDDGRRVDNRDRLEKGKLVLERSISVPAGRVQPNRYPAFRTFAVGADAALHRRVRVKLGR
jgi:tetratricopeptide (TPR) repeat protein